MVHLHVHTHYSPLDGMSKIPDLVEKCRSTGMNSIAITDHGNMYGIKEFIDYTTKINGKTFSAIKELEKQLTEATGEEEKKVVEAELEKKKKEVFKPIIGCEAYCARRTLYDKDKDFKRINIESGREQIVDASGYHIVLLAKNEKGYENLCQMISTAWIDGYYNRPRIDKDLLKKYSEGVIVSSACLGGEIPQHIIAGDLEKAEESIMWFKEVFGDDFYLEIQRHQTTKPRSDQNVYMRQKQIIPHIIELAKKTNTKIIATNDVHFVEEEHAEAHDRLICLATGRTIEDENRMHYTKQEWLKTPEEMEAIFADIPEAISNTDEVAAKVEMYSLDRAPIMPVYDIPSEFGTEEEYKKRYTYKDLFDEFTQDEKGNVVMSQEDAEAKIRKIGGYDRLYRIKLEADYLKDLALMGAKKRYGDPIPEDTLERIIFELHIMKTMGFPGYFLIVQDFITAARNMGVSVGPGRGSAAGSVVAYCLKITDVDPLKYDLLFERFLNPDRISLPDIDIDFDDDGRADVLHWVTNKYGKEKVAHIVTYGTMATKSSIKDVGRVQRIPIPEVNALTSLIPDKFAEDKNGKAPKVNISNCIRLVPELQEARNSSDQNISDMLKYAEMLEGTVRQTGIHACGVIIGADDLKKFVPLSKGKDKTGEELLLTQYEGSVIETVGLIKMDFLGLKTLSIIKEALSIIKASKGVTIDIDNIPIDDEKTYQLYSAGLTTGTFQFESVGMQKHLKALKPSTFEDLIAMNALYRPGPMEYIPSFIARKHGEEPIVYDLPVMETYLKDTYGITVYQEQVMLLSRLLANFTRGESDELRKAMGKKLRDKLDKMKPKFISQGEKNGHDAKILEKIWTDWEKFASYAFNKSHATCYSWISYQTAYLKAHYPAEFMAANLTRNRDDIKEITKFMSECQNMRLKVKGPDVNESQLNFMVNDKGELRFGLGGVKGVGSAAVESIVEERNENGKYTNIFNFMQRVNLSACNKKTIESLAASGAFDSFPEITREQFFAINPKGELTLDLLVRYGNSYQNDKLQNSNSLFGDEDDIEIPTPTLIPTEEWSPLDKLNKEKDLIGIFLSSHPLDKYKTEIMYGNTIHSNEIEKKKTAGETVAFSISGMIVSTREGITKTNKPFGIITLEDYEGTVEFPLFGKDYIEFKNYLSKDLFIHIKGRIQERGSEWKRRDDTQNSGPKQYEVKISSINLLDDVKNNIIQKLTVKIQLSAIDQTFCSDFTSLIESKRGNTELYMQVYDPELRFSQPLRSSNFKINVDQDLLEFLIENEAEEKLQFKFN